MPRVKPGASSNAPKDATPLQEQPLVATSGGRQVPVGKVVPNPRNLRGDDLWDSDQEKAETVASIKEVGLIQALVVATREAFLARYPEHEQDVGSARYVVMAGHRRFSAVLAAGLETVRVDVQDDLVAKLNLVMLEENLKRKGLDAFQEGEGYRRANVEDELSYQDIATSTGRSKSHITKRVKLLDLTEDGRDLVRLRRVSIDNAYNLLTALGQGNEKLFVDACAAMSEGRLPAKDAANLVLSSGSDRNHAAALQPSVGDSNAESLASTQTAVLTETAQPEGEEQAESAAVIPGARSKLVLPETAQPEGGESAPSKARSKETPPVASDDAERSAASARRNESCGRLVANGAPTQVEPATVRIAAAVLSAASKNALARAHSWMQAAEAPNAVGMGAASYRDHALINADATLTAHLAYAVALAEDELRASDRRRRWDHRDLSHLRHLIHAASHEPTDWEKRQLD